MYSYGAPYASVGTLRVVIITCVINPYDTHPAFYRSNVLCCLGAQVGSEFAVGPLEQQRQIEALRVLDAVLATLISEDGMNFAGLNFHVYHPETCPLGGFGLHNNDDQYGLGAGHLMRSHVADDGCLHVVSDRWVKQMRVAAGVCTHICMHIMCSGSLTHLQQR